MRTRCLALALLLVVVLVPLRADNLMFVRFEQYLDLLRRQAEIPGLSAAIVGAEGVIWARGFGFQNLETAVRATRDTPYHVADLTQTLTAALLLRCVEEGRLQLDDPVALFIEDFPEPQATVRQVASHTAQGAGGAVFQHDPASLAVLAHVVEACAGTSYREALTAGILDRLAMRDSVPGLDVATLAADEGIEPDDLERYASVLGRLALPYRPDRRGRPVASELPTGGLGAAGGLVSTVHDLARFSLALDEGLLLREETLALMWSNPPGPEGLPLPHGLGWFVQQYNGEPIYWQFGTHADAYSSLVIKAPRRELTLILLANSDRLNSPFPLAEGDVTASLFARVFLRLFVVAWP